MLVRRTRNYLQHFEAAGKALEDVLKDCVNWLLFPAILWESTWLPNKYHCTSSAFSRRRMDALIIHLFGPT